MNKLLWIATPTGGYFSQYYVMAIAKTLMQFYGKYDVAIDLAESSLIHKNRNHLLKNAYKNKADYVLFIDSDSVWNPEDVEKLIAFDRDVVSGVYKSRRPLQNVPYAPVVFRMDDGKLKVMPTIPNTPFKADAVGMGFCLLKGEVVNKMIELTPKIGYPFDYLDVGEIGAEPDDKGRTVGEDISFCYRLKKAGYDVWVHPDVKIRHLTTEMII